ncbi:uroporphyrinogen-III synthase [Brachybacterium sp. DNPG3]
MGHDLRPEQLSAVLEGRTIVIAVDRRADELAAALERHGARVLRAPALSTIPHIDDAALLERTRELIADPPEIVIATTGIGFRGWFEAAEAAGLADALRDALFGARILARGPKARGAVVGAGLTTSFVAASETAAEIGEHLRTLDTDGRRIAIQHHGAGADGLDELAAELGGLVTSLTVYRWGPSPDPEGVRRSVERTAAGEVDALVFTSAPGATGWLDAAREIGAVDAVRAVAASGDLLVTAVGPVTALPLQAEGLEVLMPERARLGALIRAVVHHYDTREAAPEGSS